MLQSHENAPFAKCKQVILARRVPHSFAVFANEWDVTQEYLGHILRK